MLNSTILVTGGAGYIGSHTAFLLAQQGHTIIVLDNLLHGQVFNYPWATFIKGDYADKNVLSTIFSSHPITAVMHFAALIDVGESVRHPQTYYENNVIKTVQLLEVMRAHAVNTLIFSSSCAVYGIPQWLPLTENHPKNPISPYGKTKLMLEMILHDFAHAYGMKYCALRYFNAAGALPEQHLGEQHKPETHLIPLLLQAALHKQPFTIFGSDHPTKDGTCVRDFLHVLDIAQAHIQALEHLREGRPSDCFNIGTGSGISVKEMVSAVESITGTPIKTIHTKARVGDPPILVADASYTQAILNWQPRYSHLDYILKTAFTFAKDMSC